MARKYSIMALAGITVCSAGAQAFDFDATKFSVNGFGTLGAVYSSEDQADYAGPGFKAKGAGYSDSVSADVDSNLGLQGVARFTDKLTGTLQLVTEQDVRGKYRTHVEWANLKYAITSDLSVRVGRTAMPSFLFSDSRKVGYAIPWVRAPHEVYDLLPITNSDGVDVSYRFRVGSVANTVQAIYGENIVDVGGGLDVKAKHVWGVFDTIEVGDLTAHLTYQEQKLYFGSYQTPNFFQTSADPVKFMALGAQYDPGQWFAAGEWARRKIGGMLAFGTIEGWYLSGGYRIGSFTPYVTVADRKPKDPEFTTPYTTEQRSYSAGARWDFMRNFNLKAEYQYIDLPRGSQGVLRVPTNQFFMPVTNFQPGGSVDLLSVSLNFVF